MMTPNMITPNSHLSNSDHNLFSVYHHLGEVVEGFKGVLLDAYGVFWQGNHAGLLPGCQEAMAALVEKGFIVGILSNSTQLAEHEMDKLKKHGLLKDRHFHFFMTSGEVSKGIFAREELPFSTPRKKFYLFGEPHPKFSSHELVFSETCYQQTPHLLEADFIYLSIPHLNGEDQTDLTLFQSKLEDMKQTHIPMVCPNPDRFAHEGNPPRAVIRQGSIAALYEELGGKVFYIGKPSEKMYSAAMRFFDRYEIFNPQDVLMVGDTPETDIRGARLFGMPSALVIKTGIMADRISHHGIEAAMNALPPSDFPTFFINYLANNEL